MNKPLKDTRKIHNVNVRAHKQNGVQILCKILITAHDAQKLIATTPSGLHINTELRECFMNMIDEQLQNILKG